MDADQGKLFVGGISWETSEEKLREYFGQYGNVMQANIMRDKATGRPRGFGFVMFSDPSVVDRVLQDQHTIDGRTVEAKRAMSREEQQSSTRAGSNDGGRSVGGGNFRTKKIFVGGLPPSLTDDSFRQYFESYGPVTDVVIMYDQNTQRPRGFGFITFDNEDAVDRVVQKNYHDLHGKQVEVKRALPKDASPGMGSRGNGGGAGSGSYGYSSGGNHNGYDSRMDSNRYMQGQNTGGAYASSGASGYGNTGYGYGAANSGMGYGGYGGYGGANPGYGGPTSAAYDSYGYASGGMRVPWNAQTASGQGAAGYGNSGAWGAAGAGTGGPAGQATSQGYGYGSGDGSYGNYGNAGSRTAGANAAGSEMGAYASGYGDANGHGGYGAGQMGYGGGYGGAQSRQTQQ